MRFFTSLGLTEALGQLAGAAEEAGFEGTTLADHVFHPAELRSRYPYSPDGSVFWDGSYPWPDPWVTIGAMAATTNHLKFITSVYILPLRHPFVAAKAIGTASVVSGGRVILGGGIGWMREEFDALGSDFTTRGARTEEIITILRLLWTGRMVEFEGRHYRFDPVQMSPAPPGPVPIYLGGESERALDRAARLADGYISVPHDLADAAALRQRLEQLRSRHGRDGQTFTFVLIDPVPGKLDHYRQLADHGVDAVIMGPPVGPSASASEHRDALLAFGESVISPMA